VQIEELDAAQVLVRHDGEVDLVPHPLRREPEAPHPPPHPRDERHDGHHQHGDEREGILVAQDAFHAGHVTRFRERL
jgi:hypothetical protein